MFVTFLVYSFLLSAGLFKINFFKKSFHEHKSRVSNGLDPDQDQSSVV